MPSMPTEPISCHCVPSERSIRALRLVEAMIVNHAELPPRVPPLLVEFLYVAAQCGAFELLSDRQARLLLAYYLKSATYDDLGREEGISHQAARVLVARATRRLRRELPLDEEEKGRRFPSGALCKGVGSNRPPTPRPPARTRHKASLELWANQEYHKRAAAAIRDASHTEAFRAKMRASWADPETRARRIAAMREGSRNRSVGAKPRADARSSSRNGTIPRNSRPV